MKRAVAAVLCWAALAIAATTNHAEQRRARLPDELPARVSDGGAVCTLAIPLTERSANA
ncbi:MAG: hypothetical protein SF097_27145 [Acidobacteriota bacterium]|nr:hypothetical protein [Acidobacteriota bacterium]